MKTPLVEQSSTDSYRAGATVLVGTGNPISHAADAAGLAGRLLRRLFRRHAGSVTVRLWNGSRFSLGRSKADELPAFELVFHTPRVVRNLIFGRDPLRFADAYFRGEVDVEGDFFAALKLKDEIESLRFGWRDTVSALIDALRFGLASRTLGDTTRSPVYGGEVRTHSKSENRDAIAFHYNVSNDFYALWLDPAMVYSCAYFETPETSLEKAQEAKLDHICRKLLLKPGEKLLDIGCGWGALILHAARKYGVRAHGITLSEEQAKLARARIAEAGLQDRVEVELCDYRDVRGEAVYDKVSSVGMFEHIGLKNLPVYFATVHRLLKPAGLFLNHGITHHVEGWEKTLSTEFINRYVFPDGQLDTISNVQRAMERSGFEIADVEGWRRHYALTLRQWVARLEEQRERALQYVNESTYRVWRLYMAACALEFESGEIGIFQVLAGKKAGGATQQPLTRRHLYA